MREVANLPKVLDWDSSKLRSWHVVACHVLVNFRRVQAKYQKPTRELKFIECHLAIYQFVFEHNSQADLVSSSFMEIFCRFTSLLASWCLILQGKIFTSFLVISHTPANFLSLMEADARRAIDSTGSITLWEPRGCTKKARCRVGASSSSSCSWCSSRDLCLGVECLPCGLRFWEHTLLRVHFLRVYIFENTLLRVCFPFLTYLARSKREGDYVVWAWRRNKRDCGAHVGIFFIADCIRSFVAFSMAPKGTEEERRRRRRLVDGSGSLTMSRSSWKLSMSSISVRP